MPTIVDPAHGGSATLGKSSALGKALADGRPEKDATLALGRQLARALGAEARLTRESDENHSLAERIAVAREARAGVFLSVHAHPPGSGTSVWAHSGASQASLDLAAAVQRELSGSASSSAEVQRGALAVLAPDRHAPETAACLVEIELEPAADTTAVGEALARALRAHGERYGRRRVAVALGNEEVVFESTDQVLAYINDRLGRFAGWQVGVDTTRCFPFSAICQLVSYDASGALISGGTGFYIGQDRLLTAGHVIVDSASGLQFSRIEVRPGKNGTTQPFPSFSVTPDACHPHQNWFDKAANTGAFNSDFDMAVIRVTTPPPNGRAFDYLDDRQMSVAPVAISGYGLVQSSLSAWAAQERQHLDIDTIRSVTDNLNQGSYDAFTEGGTSGSPVFWVMGVEDEQAQQSRYDVGLVGVHTRGYHADPTRTTDQLNSCCLMTPEKKLWAMADWSTYGGRTRIIRRATVPARAATSARPPVTAARVTTRGAAAPAKGFAAPHGSHERYGRPMARGQVGVLAPPQYNPSSSAEALEALKQWQTNLQAFLAGVSPEAHGFYPHSSICKLIIDGGSQGTGFWIGNDRILTAGHCVSGASRILVAPGRARTSTIWEVESTDLRPYPGYAPVTDTDIGIIKLPEGHRLNELEAFPLENLNMCPVGGLVVCGYASLITGHDATNTGISGMSVDPDIQHLSSGDFELEDGSSLFRLHSNLTQGTSGGPVFYVDSGSTVHVVGIAVGARFDGQYNIGVNLDQPRLDWINAQ